MRLKDKVAIITEKVEKLKDSVGRDVRREIFVKSRCCFGCPRGTFKITGVTDPEFAVEGVDLDLKAGIN